MKKTNSLLFLAAFAVSSLLLVRCGSDTDAVEQAQTSQNGASPETLCDVDPSWFPHSQTPAPEEGKGSVFDGSGATNKNFHQWSWNKFLWLTKPDAKGTPLFLTSDDIKQVTTYMQPVSVPTEVEVVLQDFNQAGSNNPLLQTNAAYGGTSETVYYSIHMNRKMYQAGVQFAKDIIDKKLPETNEETFPVGSFELKVAWVPISAIPASKLSLYYTTTASLSADGGTTFKSMKVALIGMHVVGTVQNHPEFIWATFEHDDLSPDYDWNANSASSTEETLLFKTGSVSGIDAIRFNPTTKLGYTAYHLFDLYKFGVPRDKDGKFMNTAQDEPTNFANIEGINKCVYSKLNDVWKNYFYNGSIWLSMSGKTPEEQAKLINSLGSKIGSVTPGSSARGSMNCANVTMESFTQTFQTDINDISVSNMANCFSCHKGVSFDRTSQSPIYLSHTFQDYLKKQKGVPVNLIEQLKTEDEKKTLQMLRKN